MALSIGNKTFMNLQEAVGWLLENNALPFQSTANYAGGVEIAMSTLINPSPAKVRVGSLIFFADSKVSTVVGVTSNSFIVSDQYNDLVDDITYVSNVAINASGHLICTLSNGDTIDAGLIRQISNFNIDASQHLIANYNDGTSTDLGTIFTGNVTISGTLKALTIEQTQANYVNSITPTLSATDVANGLTITNVYNRFIVIGNILYIVLINKVHNPTASPVTFSKISYSATLPSDLASKIYDVDGNPVTSGSSANINIDLSGAGIQSGVGYASLRTTLSHGGTNLVAGSVECVSTHTINANGTLNTFSRVFLTLL